MVYDYVFMDIWIKNAFSIMCVIDCVETFTFKFYSLFFNSINTDILVATFLYYQGPARRLFDVKFWGHLSGVGGLVVRR